MFSKIYYITLAFNQLLGICLTLENQNNQVIEKYDYRTEYDQEKLFEIYSQYLSDKSMNNECQREGKVSEITDIDVEKATKQANKQMKSIVKIDKKYIGKEGLIFDDNIYEANLKSKSNQFVTKNLINDKCLSELDSVLNFKNISITKNFIQNKGYCDLESDVSPSVECDPNYKYRRIDGKCNNLVNTNWGSSFHCQRRLLPPDYSDGVSQPRLATNGSPLPNPRLLSKQHLKENMPLSPFTMLSGMWGQFLAHDTFARIIYLGGNLGCCANNRSSIHPECLPMDNIPSDEYSKAYNQNCINFQRAITCNTCGLGARNHLNQMTSFLDLSHIYGLTQNSSNRLRTFTGGQMRVSQALDNSTIYPKAELPVDQERFDLESKCRPTPDRPWLTCFQTGEGIRSNQNPMVASLGIIMLRRHNQHSRALAKVNPLWDDEKLFQEARRLLIAEYNMINFNEYLDILGPKFLEEYHLKIKENGFTEYDPNVDPTGILSMGGAAFRFGHTRMVTLFQVLTESKFESYGFKLREKFFDMSDIWDGKTNAIIRGLSELKAKFIGPNIVEDLQDHLFMNKCNPKIVDLGAINIQRGRDYGLPAYVYYLQFYTGVEIKSWEELESHIPKKFVDKLKDVYHDYRDIDLYVGLLLESGLKTMIRILGLQVFHWKYGDRFFFEHGGQSGSFTIEQLNNIRQRFSLANLLCRTTDFESIRLKPFSIGSDSNPNVLCPQIPDINYELFKE